MKVPSLDLELKVLLTVVGICVFGFQRMAHVIRLSETDNISLLFVLGLILSDLVLRSARSRYKSAGLALFCLCFGLLIWAKWGLSKSVPEACLTWGITVFAGVGFFAFTSLAFRDYRKAKKKETPELQVKE